jgi:CubicO group peptidase (beta-lactamase class C family)
VAQHLVERYSGNALDDFVAKRIFAPLNMTSSSYSPSSAESTGHLSESRDSSGRRIPLWFIDADTPILGGVGGILSSAPDLVKWTKALLGVTNTTTLDIPRSVLDETMSAQSLANKRFRLTYGFGWAQHTKAGIEVRY